MTHTHRLCLDQDDQDGLNFLYPSCKDALRVPACRLPPAHLTPCRLALRLGDNIYRPLGWAAVILLGVKLLATLFLILVRVLVVIVIV